MNIKQPAVYIVSNKPNGTLYVGVISNLLQRVFQHRNKAIEGFTSKCGCIELVYYELFDTMNNAITREKQIKTWTRSKKIDLIIAFNPSWVDLYRYINNL